MNYIRHFATLNSLDSYAQCEEDIILYKLLSHIDNGNFIDIGCAEPVLLSVSYLFYKLGWRGINIDPRTDAIREHENIRPDDINLNVAVSNKRGKFTFWECGTGSTFDEETVNRLGADNFKKTESEVLLLNDILENLKWDKPVHFLKIDVEKHEREVLEGIDLKTCRPWIIAVESTLPATNIPCWNDWEDCLLNNDYKFIMMHKINRFYAAAEHYDKIMQNYNYIHWSDKSVFSNLLPMRVKRYIRRIENKCLKFIK